MAATLAGLSAGRPIGSVATVEITGKEIQLDLVENDHPMTPPFNVSSNSTIVRDVDLDRELERTMTDGGEISYRTGTFTFTAAAKPGPRQVTASQPAWSLQDPIAALRTAMKASDLRLLPDAFWHGARQHVVGFHFGRFPIRIAIGADTALPTFVEATVDYDDLNQPGSISLNALGDVAERTEYLNWSVVDGVRYPLQRDLMRDGQLQRTLVVSKVAFNVAIDRSGFDLGPAETPAPRSVQDLRPSMKVPGPYPGQAIAEIAPDIIQLPNSWYTVIVRQTDGLVIIDAPISAGYSKGVLEEAGRRFPGMRVKALVTSTGFFWHVAGVREYAARGIPIYAEPRNVPVIWRMLRAKHNLSPDDLSRGRRTSPKVICVSHRTVIGSGRNAIELFPITGATQPMLMSYVRSARLLHTAEMVQPLGPGGSILFPESLLELARTVGHDGIDVATMIGMHMGPTPWSELDRTLALAKVSR